MKLSPSVIESLEPRLAPAGLVSLSLSASGALTISGDAHHNDFQITQSGDQWTISRIHDVPGDNTEFRLNGGPQLESITFDKPVSVKATLGDGNDEMLLNGVDILKTLSVNTGNGDDKLDLTSSTIFSTVTVATGDGDDDVLFDGVDILKTLSVNTGNGDDKLDLTSTQIFSTVKVTMGNGDDYFTAGGDLYFAKGLSANLGGGPNTLDVNADTLLSDGNISVVSGGAVNEIQTFRFQVGVGEVNGSLTLKSTKGPTDFEIGLETTDSLVVSKNMILQSTAGEDYVTVLGSLFVDGTLAIKLSHGDNTTTMVEMDQLVVGALSYSGGSGLDDFLIGAREVIVDGNFSFAGSSGENILEIAPTEFFGVAGSMSYKGGSGVDNFFLSGPEVVIAKNLSVSASHGANFMGIEAVEAAIGGSLRYSGGSGSDRVDIGESDGGSDLVNIVGSTTLSLSSGAADVQVRNAILQGNLAISTSAAFGLADEVRLFESEFWRNVSIKMGGNADSYVEVRNGIFDWDVYVNTGNGNDLVRFDTDASVPGIYSWFDGYVTISLGAGNDEFYAGNSDVIEFVGNDFNYYVDVYGGTGFDTAYFVNSAAYNNGFNGPLPWWSSIEDVA
ncbi:hypothetical protein [Prosthecobacter debontii]|nr:hypothetical protein [Prosthecobacter debontii]